MRIKKGTELRLEKDKIRIK